ncbi:selenocysteine-specific translation elongation factor [Mycoplasmatota bacterium WC44]
MNNFVIGTAGHIDHGKTSLIKSLTGINTDTLIEEQKRGITVDLGFSYLKLTDDLTVGIVDVPGHEKLIKNMLSGVCGIDMILLVIAADDGVMPQTREHFDIIKFLKITNTLVVLTKTDLVSKERIAEVKKEISDKLNLTRFVEFSIYDDSSKDGVVKLIKEAIDFSSDSVKDEYFRMPIDRVFNVKGHGVVVTGSSISGEVKVGDKLEILPNNEIVRVKGIQVFKQNRDIAYKKTRVALNLGGIKKEDLVRGKVISKPKKVEPTKIIDVRLTVSNNDDILIKHLETVKFYYLANEVKARVKLFNQKSISSGDVVYAQLLLEEELYVVNKDLGVLRKLHPVTVAGVEIINAKGKYANRKNEVYAEGIKTFQSGDIELLVNNYINSNDFCHINDIKRDLDITDKQISELELDVYMISNIYLSKSKFEEFKNKILDIVTKFHDNNKNKLGINKNELLSMLRLNIVNKVFSKFLKLIDEIDVTDKVKLKTFQISLSEEESITAKRIISLLNSGDFKPAKFNDIFRSINRRNVDDVYFTLIKRGELIKFDDDIAMSKDKFTEMIRRFDVFFSENKVVSLAEARELLNTSRRYVVPYLEYLDKIGYTRRVEDGRVKK